MEIIGDVSPRFDDNGEVTIPGYAGGVLVQLSRSEARILAELKLAREYFDRFRKMIPLEFEHQDPGVVINFVCPVCRGMVRLSQWTGSTVSCRCGEDTWELKIIVKRKSSPWRPGPSETKRA